MTFDPSLVSCIVTMETSTAAKNEQILALFIKYFESSNITEHRASANLLNPVTLQFDDMESSAFEEEISCFLWMATTSFILTYVFSQ